MSKVNKILMATVAILLTLVLISTSVVSSVFARFTIKKSAETTVTLEKFGVEIKLTPKEGSLVAKGENVKKGDSVSMQFTSALAMGETLYDALKVEVTGTPSVDVKFRMTCKVDYEETKYTTPANQKDLYGTDTATLYMPLGFTISLKDDVKNNKKYVSRPYHKHNEDKIEEIIMRNVSKYLYNNGTKGMFTEDDSNYCDSNTNWFYEYSYGKDVPISGNVKKFYMGFDWLSTVTYNGDKYPTADENVNDRISTFYSEANSPIKITYTFKVVQG